MNKTIISLFSATILATVALAAPVDTSKYSAPIRVACVGDSITAGVGATKGNAYPAQLGRMLGEKWIVENFGVSGATLLNHGNHPYQKTGAFKKALASRPDVVIIKLGSNDTKPNNWKLKDEFVSDYKDLISQFAQLPSKPRIYVCYPAFVPGQGNYGINEAAVLEQINMINRLSWGEKLSLIDIHGALKDHPEMLPDRVHPNTDGATVMAKTVFQALTGKEFTGADPVVAVPEEKKKP